MRALRRPIDTLPAKQHDAIEQLELSLKEAAAATEEASGELKVATHREVGALRRMRAAGEMHGH